MRHSPRTIECWINSFNSDGLGAFYDIEKSGRPSKLSSEILNDINRDLRKDPHEFGYFQNMGDGILLKRYLLDKYNIDLEVRQCQNIFHKLGFRLRRPRSIIAKGERDLKDNFKK
ncbi:MAG: hypothetical protein QXV94_00695, partial [Thermoplasmata archaeon]